MPPLGRCTLRADLSDVLSTLEETRLLLAKDPAEIPPKITDGLLSSLNAGPEFVGQEYNAATWTLLLRFQLSESLAETLATLRACKLQGNVSV